MTLAAAHALVMVEVIPLINAETNTDLSGPNEGGRSCPPISTPSAKLQLSNMSRQGMFSEGWLSTGEIHAAYRKEETEESSFKLNVNHSRGLLLKFDMDRCPNCNSCEGGVRSANANGERNGGAKETKYNLDKPIISGNLMFQGKDVPDTNTQFIESKCSSSIAMTYLRSDDPLDEHGMPCFLRGYMFANKESSLTNVCYCQMAHHHCVITSGTAVQVCAPLDVSSIREKHINESIHVNPIRNTLHTIISGKSNVSQDKIDGHNWQSIAPTEAMGRGSCADNTPMIYSKLSCYDKETIESLSLRMSTMLENTVWIGTTPCALSTKRIRQHETESIDDELDVFWETHSNQITSNREDTNCRYNHPTTNPSKPQSKASNPVPLLLREGALLVHNSHPNSGKTTLVTTIAKDILKCHAVHVISAPALFAKYGTNADAALESMLHELALRCAVKGGATVSENYVKDNEREQDNSPPEVAKVCIILDHLETFLPLSMQASGDPYFPVLNAIGKFRGPRGYTQFQLA